MDDMYGHYIATDYADKFLTSLDNLIINPSECQGLFTSGDDHHYDHYHNRIPMFGSHELLSAASAVYQTPEIERGRLKEDDGDMSTVIKAKIVSHPSYPRLLEAYIDCRKVGAPPEIVRLLDEIVRENEVCKRDNTISTCVGADPELDEFMETYCNVLMKYKSELSRPFDEATTFLNNVEMQLGNLCKDDGAVSSDEELSEVEMEQREAPMRSEDQELKDRLLRRYGSHISTLKLEFSKKKKKEKLPRAATQTLLEWWHLHLTWPYPTEVDKISLAQSTGLDQRQINNWFINQRKRHWKPSEHMQLAFVDDNLSGQFVTDD